MPSFNGRQYTTFSGLNLAARNGVIRFETPDVTPTTTSGERLLYVTSGNALTFDSGTSITTLGAAGGLVNFGLNDAYDDGTSITVDAAAVQLAGSHATNNVLELRYTGSGTGNMIDIQNDSTGTDGFDIQGTDNTWMVSTAGALQVTSIKDSATNATLQVNGDGSGGVQIGGTSTGAITLSRAVTTTVSETITGTAATNVFTIDAGDAVFSDGSLTLTDADNAATLVVTNNTATTSTTGVVDINSTSVSTGHVVTVVANGVTSGSLLYLESSVAALTGHYIRAFDGAANVFTVGADGDTTITGSAGTDTFVITAGDAVMSDGSLTMTDADNAATFSVTNNTATTANVFLHTGSGVFTGTGATAFFNVTQSGATSGDVSAVIANGLTTGTALLLSSTGTLTTTGAMLEIVADSATTAAGVARLSADALTTGTGLDVSSSSAALAAGNLVELNHTASSATLVAKTAQLLDVISSRTNTALAGTVADDYDMLSLVRTSVQNGAGGTLTATGSILYVQNVATQTAGILTDTAKGIEVVMDVDGTGDGIEITHSATGGVALDISSAATSVNSVLITGTGVHADNTGTLGVTTSGATAAGGSVLRVTATGTPAAATSYLVDLDYSGATMTNNPVSVFLNSGASTAAALQITSSGAAAANQGHLEIESTNTGAVGPVLAFAHTSTASAANADVVGRILFDGLDAADAVESYARIDAVISDITAANPDGEINFLIDVAGTLTQRLQVSNAVNGIEVGDGAAAAIVSSNGNFDLTLQTGNATTSTISIVDGANGDIDFTVNGTGSLDVQNLRYEASSTVTTTTTLTWGGAEGQVIFATSAAGYTITLPAAATVGAGGWLKFIKTDAAANAITLDGNGAETIDGAATFAAIDAQFDTVTIYSNGTNWFIGERDIA